MECTDAPKKKELEQRTGSTESFAWLKRIFVYPVKSCGAYEVNCFKQR